MQSELKQPLTSTKPQPPLMIQQQQNITKIKMFLPGESLHHVNIVALFWSDRQKF